MIVAYLYIKKKTDFWCRVAPYPWTDGNAHSRISIPVRQETVLLNPMQAQTECIAMWSITGVLAAVGRHSHTRELLLFLLRLVGHLCMSGHVFNAWRAPYSMATCFSARCLGACTYSGQETKPTSRSSWKNKTHSWACTTILAEGTNCVLIDSSAIHVSFVLFRPPMARLLCYG
jgi:hypothetical protein